MVGRCRGGTCRPECRAWRWCAVWLATNVCLTWTEWQSARWHYNMHCSKNYMLPCCTLYQTFHNIHYYHNEKREIACNAFYNTNTQLEYIQWLQYGYYRPGVKLKQLLSQYKTEMKSFIDIDQQHQHNSRTFHRWLTSKLLCILRKASQLSTTTKARNLSILQFISVQQCSCTLWVDISFNPCTSYRNAAFNWIIRQMISGTYQPLWACLSKVEQLSTQYIKALLMEQRPNTLSNSSLGSQHWNAHYQV